MKINEQIESELLNIFKSKKDFHIKRAKLPIEEKIKILIELQKIGKIANPEKTKDNRVWKI